MAEPIEPDAVQIDALGDVDHLGQRIDAGENDLSSESSSLILATLFKQTAASPTKHVQPNTATKPFQRDLESILTINLVEGAVVKMQAFLALPMPSQMLRAISRR